MKVSTTILAFYFAFNCVLSVVAVDEENAVVPNNPCGAAEEEEEEPAECLDSGLVCTLNEESCCDGLVCTGYGFFKKCEEPPVCLEKVSHLW